MNLLTVLRRELASYVWQPLGWVVATLFLLVQGYGFYLLMELVAQPQAPHGAVMRLFFGGTFIYWLFVITVVSAITMRLVAEERRSGTLEALLTAPVSDAQVVLGKFAAALLFYLALWLPTSSYALLVARLVDDSPPDWGPVLAGYLGTLVVGATCIAIGTLCSALARGQMMALLMTFAALVLLLLLGPLASMTREAHLAALARHASLFDHMDDFGRGIVDTRHLVFHASLVVFCLVCAVQALKRRRWT